MADPRFQTVSTPRSLWRRVAFLRAEKTLFLSIFVFAVMLAVPRANALVELPDNALADDVGQGLTFTWTDFRIMFDPSSYLEQVGAAGSNTCTGTGNIAGNYNCWRRGDMRWYGLNVSAEGTTVGQTLTGGNWNTSWTTTAGNMTQCASAGVAGLGCPRGAPTPLFAAHDNPYILRVQSYPGDGTAATSIGNGVVTYEGSTSASLWPTGATQTVLEWLAPTAQDDYRFSFWGEIEVGRGGTGTGLLKTQTIISGNASGSILRFWKFTQTHTSPGAAAAFNPLLGAAGCTNAGCASVDGAGSVYNNRSLALQYESHLRGDFRFSAAQTEAAPVIGIPVDFNATEGLYFRNADVYVPLGQPYYQALTINVPRNTGTNAAITDGNFTLEIPLLPNRTAVFTRFYSLNTTPGVTVGGSVTQAWDYGYATARSFIMRNTSLNTATYMPDADITTAPFPTNYPAPNANYSKTHGYAHWGDWYTCQGIACIYPTTANSAAQALAGTGRNAWNSTGDGTFFTGTTAFNAYSYRPTTVDVSAPGSDTYSLTVYMADVAACGGITTCGYGGPWVTTTAQNGGAALVTSVNMVAPENSWYTDAGMGAAVARNVVPIAAGGTVNIGDSRLEGIQINFLRLTSYGANF